LPSHPTARAEEPIPTIYARAILFDLDGVLVDSRLAVEAVWRKWAAPRGLDPEPFIRIAPGRRTSETLRLVAPQLDAAREVAVLDAMEEAETHGLTAVAGAVDLLEALGPEQWAIVTSGSPAVASLRLAAGGLSQPRVFVTGDRVRRGKPDPEGYRLAARLLGLPPAGCLVIEDSPPGVAAGRAARMRVIGLATTHEPAALREADFRIERLSVLEFRAGPTGGPFALSW
jgi:sugar-phosphatase